MKPLLFSLGAVVAVACATGVAEEPAIASTGQNVSAQLLVTPDAEAEALVGGLCTSCHSIDRPATLAPPLRMILRHYLTEYGQRDRAETAVRDWLAGPDSAHSVLPAHAIERFGLMPPLPLSDPQRAAVAEYLFDELGDARAMAGQGMMRGEGVMERGTMRRGDMQRGAMQGHACMSGDGGSRGPGMNRGRGLNQSPGTNQGCAMSRETRPSCPRRGG